MTAPPPTGDRDVVVIGGGLAGLAAATALADADRRVTVLEGRGSLGGRAQSFVHSRTGDELDTGQHVLMGCYDDMLAFLERIGARGLVRLQPSLEVVVVERGGRRSVLACPALPAPLHLAVGLLRFRGLGVVDKLKCLRVIGDSLARRDDPALDTLTVSEWLESLGQSERAQAFLWTPLCLATLNAAPGKAPASLMAVVLARAFLSSGQGSSIGISTVGLTSLHAAQARRHVESRGGEVLLNQPVTSIEIEDGRAAGIRLRDGQLLRSRALVSAVPASTLHRLLPPILRERAPFATLPLFEPSPIVSLHLWLDRRVLDVPFVGLVDSELHWIFDRALTWTEPARGGHLVTLVTSGADELAAADREEVLRRCWAELVAYLPEAAHAQVLDWEVVKEKSATFRAFPGLSAHRFGPATPVEGLWVAGDWTATGLPATMEGACASGHAAASAVLRR